jgi:apolipoprotein D and lipocalin family protein
MKTLALRCGLLLVALSRLARGDGCRHPAPVPGFNSSQYLGTWFEIAKIQTLGGAIFESECVCTQLVIEPTEEVGVFSASNLCRKKTPQGQLVNATGTLSHEGPPGRWQESFFSGVPGVNYTVIDMGEEGADSYAVEYDCGDPLGVSWLTNYCIHILARRPTMSPALLEMLVARAVGAGLNPQNITLKLTEQEGCWGRSLRGE